MIVSTYNSGKEDGKWVYGLLCEIVGKWIIRQFEYDRADYVSYEVDPETVCQYTGFKDKNKKEIFENDIVKLSDACGGFFYAIVKFGSYKGEFCSKEHSLGFFLEFIGEDIPCIIKRYFLYWCKYGDLEVIGNIFDNPELLEVD